MRRNDDPYLSQAEFNFMRRVLFIHRLVAWLVALLLVAGFGTLALNVFLLFAG